MGAVGLSEDQLKSGSMPLIYGLTFVFSLIASWTLAGTRWRPMAATCSSTSRC